MAITLRVAEHLKQRGWTAYRLAKEAKVSQPVAYRYAQPNYRFRCLKQSTLEKICIALNCQPGDLLHWDRPKTQERKR